MNRDSGKIQWIINGGITLTVPTDAIPPLELPRADDCSVLCECREPTFHITLIGRKAIQPFALIMMRCMDKIQAAVPASPSPLIEPTIREMVDGERRTWYLHIQNQADFTAAVDGLTATIDGEFQRLGHAGFTNREPSRYFHISVANNQGGDPRASIGTIQPSRTQEEK